MENDDIELRTQQINHAMSVIGHLQGTLDRERGGEVSRKLDRFYGSVRGCLTEAHIRVSKEILYQQISDLLSVREAWVEVDQATSSSSSAPPTTADRDTESLTTAKAGSDWTG